MIEVRKAVVSLLKTIHPRVYFLRAPETAAFPYLVYEIEITELEDGLKMLTLDVDGWDNNPDTTSLENLMSQVHAKLNRSLVTNEALQISFYAYRQLSLTDEDPQFNRRKYVFEGRLYER